MHRLKGLILFLGTLIATILAIQVGWLDIEIKKLELAARRTSETPAVNPDPPSPPGKSRDGLIPTQERTPKPLPPDHESQAPPAATEPQRGDGVLDLDSLPKAVLPELRVETSVICSGQLDHVSLEVKVSNPSSVTRRIDRGQFELSFIGVVQDDSRRPQIIRRAGDCARIMEVPIDARHDTAGLVIPIAASMEIASHASNTFKLKFTFKNQDAISQRYLNVSGNVALYEGGRRFESADRILKGSYLFSSSNGE